ncbi:MAG: hypothetical protein KJ063_15820 [Anaerolineae bacterium]|nr:hypothetical protein [Anaerolineae bacterium]
MDKFAADKQKWESRPRRHSISLFGPILLIALGLYFFANNLGLAPALHWGAALRLWPLFLVFAGLNIIARQIPRPFGTLASMVVGFIAVAVLGAALLFADRIPALQSYSGTEPTFQTETIQFSASEIRSADIDINFASPRAILYPLSDSPHLITGEVSYQGQLIFDRTVAQGHATVALRSSWGNEGWLDWLNPSNWRAEAAAWRIGLNPTVPMGLTLNFASGAMEADLTGLNLTELNVKGASGSAVVRLPDGEYEVNYDMASGAVDMTLPERGHVTLNIQGSSGSVNLLLPETMEMRIVVRGSSGSFQPGGRLEQVGSEGRSEIWQTSGYREAAENRLEVQLDISSGSVRVGRP